MTERWRLRALLPWPIPVSCGIVSGMTYSTLPALLIGLIGLGPTRPACPFVAWTTYQGTSILRHPETSAYLYRTSGMKVDADGAPNAYHPDDVGLHCTRGVGFKGLDCPDNAGYPGTPWWPSILVPDPANPAKPFIQAAGPFAGFFVSKTSLEDGSKGKADPARYVDATRVPYLVFPRAFYRLAGTGRLGDFGYAINLRTRQTTPFVVAEIGPSTATLGEGSIALAERLGGSNPNPRTGAGTPSGSLLYVLFPNSSRSHPWPVPPEAMVRIAEDLLAHSGGLQSALACVHTTE